MQHEVVPVTLPVKKGSTAPATVVSQDEEFTSIKVDKVPTLAPAFGKPADGATVTAANASKLSGLYNVLPVYSVCIKYVILLL